MSARRRPLSFEEARIDPRHDAVLGHNELGYNAALRPGQRSLASRDDVSSMVKSPSKRRLGKSIKRFTSQLLMAGRKAPSRVKTFDTQLLPGAVRIPPQYLENSNLMRWPGESDTTQATANPPRSKIINRLPLPSNSTLKPKSEDIPEAQDYRQRGNVPISKYPSRQLHPEPQHFLSESPPLPRASPILLQVPVDQRAEWVKNHPKRTTSFDSAVKSIQSVDSRPGSSNRPNSGAKLSINARHTFEVIMGYDSSGANTLGAMHALSPQGKVSSPETEPLASGAVQDNGKLTSKTGEVLQPLARTPIAKPPVLPSKPDKAAAILGLSVPSTQTSSLNAVPSLLRPRHVRKPVPPTKEVRSPLPLESDMPNFSTLEEKQTTGEPKGAIQVSMHNELHYKYTAVRRDFRLPFQSAGGQSGLQRNPGRLRPAERKQANRISDSFLRAGPDLHQAATEIFDEVLKNPPKFESVKARVFAIERGFEGSHPSPGSTFDYFDHSRFPILDMAAQNLNRGESMLRHPLPLGHTSRNGSPATIDRSVFTDFEWQRFSHQEYVDPAVEDFQRNRRRRMNKRKLDLAAWKAAAAQGRCVEAEPAASPRRTDRDANLLTLIDFADDQDRSPPRSRDGGSQDLIDF
ncbi:uncharacterized protein HMPREF1541_05720 [Cyphellophora europaea CBS 101466]|uniref:Uncharacterized protein n=1 Tax=Cyphellophora europaea (strain CBS 101466) TaxID=1220924 RepID=W2RUX1_CYPE1|nr:uncharacterized protein HMPREF1541_05720 [Cyphellophora europaea CBS 101466]ETN39494.1 hypothetical protein HMPREF1541_05720 [Cyphellophora europaea CBS 101466]